MRNWFHILLATTIASSILILTACDGGNDEPPAPQTPAQNIGDPETGEQSTPGETDQPAGINDGDANSSGSQSSDGDASKGTSEGAASTTQTGDQLVGDTVFDDAPDTALPPKSAGSWLLDSIGLAGVDVGIPLSSIKPGWIGIVAQLTVRSDATATITIEFPENLSTLSWLLGDVDPSLVSQLQGQTVTINGTWKEDGTRVTLTLTDSSVAGLIPAGTPLSANVGVVPEDEQLAILATATDLELDDKFPGATLTLEFKRE